MPSKPSSHDAGLKVESRLTREALFRLRLNQLRDRDASTQYISLYTPTIDSDSSSSELHFDSQDEARILALELALGDMASSISSTEASRQRKIAARENYTTAAPFGSRTKHVRSTKKMPEQSEGSQRTSSSHHNPTMRFRRVPPQPPKHYSKPSQSFDDSTWRHGADFRRLKEQALEAARFRPETREQFGMNVFAGEPEVDWDEEDNAASTQKLDSNIPDVFPPHTVVGSAAELGTYLASSNYVISLGGPPLPEMRYGIIIVPVNEERLLFPGYGDHAAMPAELHKEIHSKSKAMQHEQVEALRQQAADQAANRVNEERAAQHDDEDDVPQRKWTIPIGDREGVTWVIHTGVTPPVAYYNHDEADHADTSDIGRHGRTKRETSTPRPKAANQSISESVPSAYKPRRANSTPLQSSVPDTADYDDKTEDDETEVAKSEDEETELAKSANLPETESFGVKRSSFAKSPVQNCEKPKEQPKVHVKDQPKEELEPRSVPLPISSESDDREWFRDYFRRSLSPHYGMKPSEEDNHQFRQRRRRAFERGGVASEARVEDDANLKHPRPTRSIAQILVHEDDDDDISQQKDMSLESSGSQTSDSVSLGSFTETDATSNPNPADLEKPATPLQPAQKPRPAQSMQPIQPPQQSQPRQRSQSFRPSQSPRPTPTQSPRPSQRPQSPQSPKPCKSPKLPQPIQPSQLLETVYSAQPLQRSQSLQPSQPTQPSQLLQPSQPIQPSQLLDTVQSSQPLQRSQSLRLSQSPRPSQRPMSPLSPQLPQPSQSPQLLQPVQPIQPSQLLETVQPAQPAQPSQPLKPSSAKHSPNDAHDKPARRSACDTIKHLLRVPEKRPATPQVGSVPRKMSKARTPPPKLTAQARNARLDATRAITSMATSDPNEHPGIDPLVREAAEVGLGYKQSRPQHRVY